MMEKVTACKHIFRGISVTYSYLKKQILKGKLSLFQKDRFLSVKIKMILNLYLPNNLHQNTYNEADESEIINFTDITGGLKIAL